MGLVKNDQIPLHRQRSSLPRPHANPVYSSPHQNELYIAGSCLPRKRQWGKQSLGGRLYFLLVSIWGWETKLMCLQDTLASAEITKLQYPKPNCLLLRIEDMNGNLRGLDQSTGVVWSGRSKQDSWKGGAIWRAQVNFSLVPQNILTYKEHYVFAFHTRWYCNLV